MATWSLLRSAVEAAERRDIDISVGTVFTSDLFYGPHGDTIEKLQRHGVLGVEMEIAALYAIAAAEGVSALGLLTVSDNIVTGEVMTSKQREDTFDNMFQIALDIS